jgi:LmbE family N-acetylglucosaminyl deacetylase
MPRLELPIGAGSKYRILCLGAHPDDIEIGCGGTILKLASAYLNDQLEWVVFSADKTRAVEAQKSFDRLLKRISAKRITINNFKESFFPYNGADIKKYFEELRIVLQPDLIFTHYRDDLHQDHRLISELTWNTFRDHLILEYEIPKYDGDLGTPNVFVPLDRSICADKITCILESFGSQKSKHWFDEEIFLPRLGLEEWNPTPPANMRKPSYCRKMVLK